MFRKISLALLLSLLLPFIAQAMPCHCYSARDFNPQEPAAADPYYLTTGQNSFFSIVFGMEKKSVVFAKQKPRTTAENLWVTSWLSTVTGKKEKILKKTKNNQKDWLKALRSMGISSELFPATFWNLLQRKADDETLAQFIVDEMLKSKAGISTQEITALRAMRANNKETILASFIGIKTFQPPSALYHRVSTGETTWGTLILKSGMKGRDMVEEIKTLINEQKNG